MAWTLVESATLINGDGWGGIFTEDDTAGAGIGAGNVTSDADGTKINGDGATFGNGLRHTAGFAQQQGFVQLDVRWEGGLPLATSWVMALSSQNPSEPWAENGAARSCANSLVSLTFETFENQEARELGNWAGDVWYTFRMYMFDPPYAGSRDRLRVTVQGGAFVAETVLFDVPVNDNFTANIFPQFSRFLNNAARRFWLRNYAYYTGTPGPSGTDATGAACIGRGIVEGSNLAGVAATGGYAWFAKKGSAPTLLTLGSAEHVGTAKPGVTSYRMVVDGTGALLDEGDWYFICKGVDSEGNLDSNTTDVSVHVTPLGVGRQHVTVDDVAAFTGQLTVADLLACAATIPISGALGITTPSGGTITVTNLAELLDAIRELNMKSGKH